jgi:hypothetical protein
MMRLSLTCGAIVALAVLAACGSGTTPSVGQETLQQICAADPSDALCQPVATSTPLPAATPDNLVGPIGTTYTDTDDNSNEIEMTLTGITDPARASEEFEGPDAGTRYVAAQFTITGVTGTFSDDADSEASAIGSDSQTYQPSFFDVSGCTNFNDGDFTVIPNQTSKGCVVFEIPNGVKVAQIEWGGGELGGTPAIWNIA